MLGYDVMVGTLGRLYHCPEELLDLLVDDGELEKVAWIPHVAGEYGFDDFPWCVMDYFVRYPLKFAVLIE